MTQEVFENFLEYVQNPSEARTTRLKSTQYRDMSVINRAVDLDVEQIGESLSKYEESRK